MTRPAGDLTHVLSLKVLFRLHDQGDWARRHHFVSDFGQRSGHDDKVPQKLKLGVKYAFNIFILKNEDKATDHEP